MRQWTTIRWMAACFVSGRVSVVRYGVAVSAVDEAGLSAEGTAGVGPVWLTSGVGVFGAAPGWLLADE